jgi:hypothetical protein
MWLRGGGGGGTDLVGEQTRYATVVMVSEVLGVEGVV